MDLDGAAIAGNRETGGIIGVISTVSEGQVVLENCYNRGDLTGYNTGGILGRKGQAMAARPIFRSCYSAGSISKTGGGAKGGLIGNPEIQGYILENCYYDITLADMGAVANSNRTPGLTTAQFKTWAAAWLLNDKNVDGIWTTDDNGVNDGYPVLGPALGPPRDWVVIGESVDAGLIGTKPSGDGVAMSYQITTPEELAWFAYRVNTSGGNETIKNATIVNALNLTGSTYGGTDSQPIPWAPIGTQTNIFEGAMDGKGNVISCMYVKWDGYAGMFGCVGGGAEIRGIGLDSTCSISADLSGTSALDGTSALVGAVISDGTSTPQVFIKNCYNQAAVSGKTGVHTGAFVGTYVGTSGIGGQRISNCYTTGVLTANQGTPGAIAGTFTNHIQTPAAGIVYCYWNRDTSSVSGRTLSATAGTMAVTVRNTESKSTSDMNTSAAGNAGGMLGYLNTEVGNGIWSRDDAVNDGYPTFTSTGVADWEDVAADVLPPGYRDSSSHQTAGTADNPYQLKKAEDLAWFACQVNHGSPGICGELNADINLFGGTYTGTNYVEGDSSMAGLALLWVPIGTDTADGQYTGTFSGNGHQISMMRADGSGKQGLFGAVGDGGRISEVGISAGSVTGETAGGIAGSIVGNAVIVRCYNRGGSVVTAGAATGGTVSYAGGIVGQMSGSAGIKDCYHLDSMVSSTGTTTYAGGIAGDAGVSGTIENCYNACGTSAASAPITAAGTGGAGSIVGTGGVLNQCYSEAVMSGDSSYVIEFDLSSNEKIWEQTDGLNTVGGTGNAGGTERTGDNRVWFTSLGDETTRGLPTFEAPEMIAVTLPAAETADGTTGNL